MRQAVSMLAALCLAWSLAGCSTYVGTTDGISTRMSHSLDGNILEIRATVTNNGTRAVTLVDHPDFSSISVYAKDREKDEAKKVILLHFAPARPRDIKTIQPGESYVFAEKFGIDRISPTTVEIRDAPSWKESPRMRIWDTYLRSSFHYEFYKDYFPWHAKFGRPGVVNAEIEDSEVFRVP